MKTMKYILIVLTLVTLVACGDSGSDSDHTMEAIFYLSLSGPDATLGSVYMEVQLPKRFALATTNGDLNAGVVTLAAGDANTYFEAAYTPEDPTTYGVLTMSIIDGNGFSVGPLATVARTMDPYEIPPLNEEFVVLAATITDLNGVVLDGYTLVVTPDIR